jgi:hypothetical protein
MRWLLLLVNCRLRVMRWKSMVDSMGAEELKKRFPMLRIRIYDAQTQTREDVELT